MLVYIKNLFIIQSSLIENKKLKAAVIGLGVGAHQARTLSAHDKFELVWICDFDKEKLTKIGSELTEAKQTQNDKDVLLDPDIDVVCIASYDESHYRQVLEALNHGKHVYVEKPICMTKNEAQNIRLKLRDNPTLRLSSNMVLRTCPLFKKLKQTIKCNTMGSIYYSEADYFYGRKEKLVSGWRAEADFYSIIYGAAVHMIDLIMWMTEKKPLRVHTLGNQITTVGTKQKNNDFAVMLLEFEDNMIVKISAHGGCVHPHFHSLKVFGTNSSFIHQLTGTVWLETSNPHRKFKKENEEYPAKMKRSSALISFLDSLIKHDKTALVSETEVFDVMSVCLAAEEATQTGKIVEIKYL